MCVYVCVCMCVFGIGGLLGIRFHWIVSVIGKIEGEPPLDVGNRKTISICVVTHLKDGSHYKSTIELKLKQYEFETEHVEYVLYVLDYSYILQLVNRT